MRVSSRQCSETSTCVLIGGTALLGHQSLPSANRQWFMTSCVGSLACGARHIAGLATAISSPHMYLSQMPAEAENSAVVGAV